MFSQVAPTLPGCLNQPLSGGRGPAITNLLEVNASALPSRPRAPRLNARPPAWPSEQGQDPLRFRPLPSCRENAEFSSHEARPQSPCMQLRCPASRSKQKVRGSSCSKGMQRLGNGVPLARPLPLARRPVLQAAHEIIKYQRAEAFSSSYERPTRENTKSTDTPLSTSPHTPHPNTPARTPARRLPPPPHAPVDIPTEARGVPDGCPPPAGSAGGDRPLNGTEEPPGTAAPAPCSRLHPERQPQLPGLRSQLRQFRGLGSPPPPQSLPGGAPYLALPRGHPRTGARHDRGAERGPARGSRPSRARRRPRFIAAAAPGFSVTSRPAGGAALRGARGCSLSAQ